MLLELVESNRKPSRSRSGAIASVAVHTGLICLAIAATANARTQRTEATLTLPKITWVTSRPAQPMPAAPHVRPVQKPVRNSLSQMQTAPMVAPLTVPASIPAASVDPGPATASEPSTGGSISSAAPDPGMGSGTGPLTAFEVDRPVRALSSNRAPVYPDVLRSHGIEGEVFARFVVDEAGRVDMKTFEVISASSPPFAAAVRYSIERARFKPAEAAGRRVAQLVEQHFQFRLDR